MRRGCRALGLAAAAFAKAFLACPPRRAFIRESISRMSPAPRLHSRKHFSHVPRAAPASAKAFLARHWRDTPLARESRRSGKAHEDQQREGPPPHRRRNTALHAPSPPPPPPLRSATQLRTCTQVDILCSDKIWLIRVDKHVGVVASVLVTTHARACAVRHDHRASTFGFD